MAIFRIKNLRDMSAEERAKKLDELNLELFKERGKIDVGGVSDNPGKIQEIKRTIAKILTIEREIKG
ncbi:MAG: 50S ribosomal protein L29 [archaeon]|nr:50S ribosomal protein L29 [archaeon]